MAGLPLLVLAAGAVSLALMPVANALSRAHERRADRYALTMTRNAPAFITAMKRLAAQNLAEEEPSRLVQVLFHTHPPINARIAGAQSVGGLSWTSPLKRAPDAYLGRTTSWPRICEWRASLLRFE